MYTTVQQYVSQYRNINFSTKIKVSVQKNWKRKIGQIGRYFIYDYYRVPKYMHIILYLNKPYIFHYYKLSRLYSTKHNHTPLYNPIHHHPPPCTPTPHQIPLNIHPFITPCTSIPHSIHHHTPTIHPCITPCTSIPHHTPMYNTMNPLHRHIPLYITIDLYTWPWYTSVW